MESANRPFLSLLLGAASFCGCFPTHKYRHTETVLVERDGQGRVRLEKYRKWTNAPAGYRLATFEKKYDSLGRVSTEFIVNDAMRGGRTQLIVWNYDGMPAVRTRVWIQWLTRDSTIPCRRLDSCIFRYPVMDLALVRERLVNGSYEKSYTNLSPRGDSVYYVHHLGFGPRDTIPQSAVRFVNGNRVEIDFPLRSGQ